MPFFFKMRKREDDKRIDSSTKIFLFLKKKKEQTSNKFHARKNFKNFHRSFWILAVKKNPWNFAEKISGHELPSRQL